MTRNVAVTLRVADRWSEPVLSWRGVALASGVPCGELESDEGVRLRLLMLSMRAPARERLRLGVLSVVGVLHGLRPADGCTSRTCEATSLSGLDEKVELLRLCPSGCRGGVRYSVDCSALPDLVCGMEAFSTAKSEVDDPGPKHVEKRIWHAEDGSVGVEGGEDSVAEPELELRDGRAGRTDGVLVETRHRDRSELKTSSTSLSVRAVVELFHGVVRAAFSSSSSPASWRNEVGSAGLSRFAPGPRTGR